MISFDDVLHLHDYALPPELIAQKPTSPRDAARLLVYDRKTGKTFWTQFREIGTFLPKNAILVLNETKVIPARLMLARSTGGKIPVLRLGIRRGKVQALSPKKLRIGERLFLGKRAVFAVDDRDGSAWILRPLLPMKKIDALFARRGHMPLPPYIKHSPLTERQLRTAYQTVFAKKEGSIAAPTASLHLTKKLLKDLQKSGVTIAYTTLHVHLGTFAPLTEEQWKSGKLHREEFFIAAPTAGLLTRAKEEGRPIVAVGTTVLRTLESAADTHGTITKKSGDTQLFIREGYRFRMVDHLITNFHVPKSSLLMLVGAFAGHDVIMDLYKEAIDRKFRFFSFGDAMLII